MGLPLMSLLMAVVVSQAAASEDEGAQDQENPMDGRAVLCSGGSNGVGEWKVDNALLNVARRPQATAGTSTILVK